MTSEEKYIKEKLNGIRPTCKCGCGMPVKYRDSYKGFTKFYSYECRSNYNRKNKLTNKQCPTCGKLFDVLPSKDKTYCSPKCAGASELTKKNRKETVNEKYGVENISKDSNIKEKVKNTCIKKYGTEYYLQSNDVKIKGKHTNIEKYGVDHPRKSKIVADKIVETNLLKYGVPYGFQSEDVKDKIKRSNKERYGVEYPLLNKNIQDKAKQTLIDKYGVDNISKSDDIKEGKRINSLNRYGTDSILQAQEIKEKIKDTLRNKYGVENIAYHQPTIDRKNEETRQKFYYKLKENNWFNDHVEFISPVGDYKGTMNDGIYNRYEFKCKMCYSKFDYTLRSDRIPRCPTCNPPNISLAEKNISKYIESLGIKVENNNKSVLDGLELDIYIPSKKIAIEYNGLYWHSELNGKDKKYHINKTSLCKNKGIRLIHIFEDEWINKEDIVKNKLRHILGCLSNKVYARNTIIQEITSSEKNAFLDIYHIQGKDNSNINLGLYYNEELISVMTFSKPRRSLGQKNKKDGVWELSRFASSLQVVGGASKLLSKFIKLFNPTEVYTYADLRWTSLNNNLYETIGMELVHQTEPNYWYVHKNGIKRYHRFTFRKRILSAKLKKYNDDLTEWQNMQINGYDRVWDCGHLKYSLKRK